MGKYSWLWTLLALVIVVIAVAFFAGRIPLSTLPVQEVPELETRMKGDVCGDPGQLFPVTTVEWPFPVQSPDGRYYFDLVDVDYRNAKELRIFESGTERLMGTYSYRSMIVYCWAEDSSGIYLADHIPGDPLLSLMFWVFGPQKGAIKIVMVP
ncbi:MAG: hypothetical protein R3300_17495 [Candidatus Promineifilaceae bacterium]|nr:hypothetical protein [Candidatus Promineifilaceae bacterium]